MRVLHINTNVGGGAAAAAIRIHKAQVEAGIDSHILFLKGKPSADVPNAHTLSEFIPSPFVFLLDKLNRLLNYRFQVGRKKCFFNSPYTLFRLHKLKFVRSFDVINLHWVVKFVDIPSFFTQLHKPIVWTIHDMNPFSGGLHYLTDYPQEDYQQLEERFKQIKKKAFSQARTALVAPSVWLFNEAKNSEIFPVNTVFVNIKNPIDLANFSPNNQATEEQMPVVLFVAEKSGDNRKGIGYLYAAIEQMDRANIDFVVLGESGKNCPDYIKQAGFISSQKEIANWYRKASVFVIPSIEDNLPNTVVESLACGTPVVGFDTGGIKDMIVHKENGFLVPNKNAEKLAEGIQYVLENNRDKRLSKAARAFAEQHFSNQTIAEQYKRLYKKMTEVSQS